MTVSYVVFEKNNTHTIKMLLECNNDIKAWMAQNFANMNDQTKEMMDFPQLGI